MGRPTTLVIGERFGRLVITDIISNGKGRGVTAVCDCDCGTKGHRVGRTSIGKMKSCGCAQHDPEFRKPRAKDSYPKKTEGSAELTSYFASYRKAAERRGFVFALSRDEFAKITSENCWYCGAEPKLRLTLRPGGLPMYNGGAFVNGVDRINNSEGYTLSNVVACCTACNMMKHTNSGATFLEQVGRIAKRHGL